MERRPCRLASVLVHGATGPWQPQGQPSPIVTPRARDRLELAVLAAPVRPSGGGGGGGAPRARSSGAGRGWELVLRYRCRQYLYCPVARTFLPVPAMPEELDEELCRLAEAATIRGAAAGDAERAQRAERYGPNALDVPVKGLARLLAEEACHPFYVFQYASVATW